MWFTGHFAIAYLITRPFFGKAYSNPWIFPLVLLFSSAPDILKILNAGHFAHSLVGNLAVATVFSLLSIPFLRNSKIYFPVLFISAAQHFLGDVLFSTYFLMYPISDRGMILINTGYGMRIMVEVLLTSVFLLVLYLTGDLEKIMKGTGGGVSERKRYTIHPFRFDWMKYPTIIGVALLGIGEIIVLLITRTGDLTRIRIWIQICLMVLMTAGFIRIFLFNKGSLDPRG